MVKIVSVTAEILLKESTFPGGWPGGWVGGWVAGWLEKLELRLNSASVEVEVELSGVEAELGN